MNTECLHAAIKDASEPTVRSFRLLTRSTVEGMFQLDRLATLLAEFSRPFGRRKMRVRIAASMGVTTQEGKTLKRAFALKCLADSDEEVGLSICPLPLRWLISGR